MEQELFDLIHRTNYILGETDALYHRVAVKMNVNDSVMKILYVVYDNGGSCLLTEVCRQSGLSRQTVSSALRNLEKDGILSLERHDGRAKRIVLTEKGRKTMNETAGVLFEMELRAFSGWDTEEIRALVSLEEKYMESFRSQVEDWEARV